jgi:hypothetical protein
MVYEPVHLSVHFLVEDSLKTSVQFKIIDNRTNAEEPIYGLQNDPHVYEPNDVGFFTILKSILITPMIRLVTP